MKKKSKHKILKEKDTNKDKKIITSKLRFRGTFSLYSLQGIYFRTFC